jgi:hypothetical protein
MNRSPWLLALTHPLNMIMLVAAFAAGLISAWWLFPLGLLLWFVMLLKIALDPALRINQMIQDRSGLPQRFETPFSHIEKSQVSLFNALSSAKSPVKQAFEPLQVAVNELVDHTYQLCTQMTPLENYQQVNSNSNPETELNQLDRLIATLDDPAAKKGYDTARQALLDKVNQKKGANDRLSQMDALLISISSDMDNLMADTARAQAMRLADIQQQIPGMVEKVKGLINQLQVFEQQH